MVAFPAAALAQLGIAAQIPSLAQITFFPAFPLKRFFQQPHYSIEKVSDASQHFSPTLKAVLGIQQYYNGIHPHRQFFVTFTIGL